MSDFLKRPLSVQHPKLSIGWFRTNAGYRARGAFFFRVKAFTHAANVRLCGSMALRRLMVATAAI